MSLHSKRKVTKTKLREICSLEERLKNLVALLKEMMKKSRSLILIPFLPSYILDKVSLCSPDYPAAQARFLALPVSDFQVLRLKAYTTILDFSHF